MRQRSRRLAAGDHHARDGGGVEAGGGTVDLLRRVYDIDIRTCPNCGQGRLEPIATILDPDVIVRILGAMALQPARRRADAAAAASRPAPSRDPISSIPAALSMVSGAYAWAATPPIPLAGASADAHARPDTAGKTHQDRGSSAFVPAAGKTPAAPALDVRGRRAFVFPIELRPNAPDAYKDIARANLAAKFDALEKHMAGRQYLTGDAFTAADAYLFTVMSWGKFTGIDIAR